MTSRKDSFWDYCESDQGFMSLWQSPRLGFIKLNGLIFEQGHLYSCLCACIGPVLCQSDLQTVFRVLPHRGIMPWVCSDVHTPDHYPDAELASQSLTLMSWAPNSSSRGLSQHPPACLANPQQLHTYSIWVGLLKKYMQGCVVDQEWVVWEAIYLSSRDWCSVLGKEHASFAY